MPGLWSLLSGSVPSLSGAFTLGQPVTLHAQVFMLWKLRVLGVSECGVSLGEERATSWCARTVAVADVSCLAHLLSVSLPGHSFVDWVVLPLEVLWGRERGSCALGTWRLPAGVRRVSSLMEEKGLSLTARTAFGAFPPQGTVSLELVLAEGV